MRVVRRRMVGRNSNEKNLTSAQIEFSLIEISSSAASSLWDSEGSDDNIADGEAMPVWILNLLIRSSHWVWYFFYARYFSSQ